MRVPLKISKIQYFCIYMFGATLFLPMLFTNIITILMLLILIIKSFKMGFPKIRFNKVLIPMILLFSCTFLGFAYNLPTDEIYPDIERKLSFLIIPFYLSTIDIEKKHIKMTMRVFFWSGFLVSTYAFLIGVLNLNSTADISYLFNHKVSQNIGFHATYLSMYLLLSLLYPSVILTNRIKDTYKKLVLGASILLFVYLIFLSVRITWIALVMCSMSTFLSYKKINYTRVLKSLFIGLSIVFVVFAVALVFKPLQERIKESINYNDDYSVEQVWGGRGIRFMIWSSALELLEKKPVFGYGSAIKVQKELDNSYRRNQRSPLLFMMKERDRSFNPHNQYLEELLKYGIVLGLLLPILLWYWLFDSYRTKNILWFNFLIIVSMTFFTETLLELNKGIVFFSFFTPLVSIYHKRIKDKFLKA